MLQTGLNKGVRFFMLEGKWGLLWKQETELWHAKFINISEFMWHSFIIQRCTVHYWVVLSGLHFWIICLQWSSDRATFHFSGKIKNWNVQLWQQKTHESVEHKGSSDFPGAWIGRTGPIAWPARSAHCACSWRQHQASSVSAPTSWIRDEIQLDFFLWCAHSNWEGSCIAMEARML